MRDREDFLPRRRVFWLSLQEPFSGRKGPDAFKKDRGEMAEWPKAIAC